MVKNNFMKKNYLLILLALLSFNLGYTQVFESGSNHLQFGYGFGLNNSKLLSSYQSNNSYKYSGFGPILGSFEHGINDNIGISGAISYSSFGGSWIQESYLASYKYSYRWSTLSMMIRGAYHFNLNNDKFDPYTGIGIGFLKYSYKWTSTDPNFNESNNNVSLGTPFGYQIFAGARYLFTDKIGAYAEIGYGFSVLNLGLSLKM